MNPATAQEHLAAVQRALDFIEDHLTEEISIADAANAAGHSLFHFCRVFNRVVYSPPYDYLIRRRLSEAALCLRMAGHSVTHTAFEYRFQSVETFIRAFRRMFTVTPYTWKKSPDPDLRLIFPRPSGAQLEEIGQPGFSRPEIVQLEQLVLETIEAQAAQDARLTLQRLAETYAGAAETFYAVIHYQQRDPAGAARCLVGAAAPACPAGEMHRFTLAPGRYLRLQLPSTWRTFEQAPVDLLYRMRPPDSQYHFAAPVELFVCAGHGTTAGRSLFPYAVYVPLQAHPRPAASGLDMSRGAPIPAPVEIEPPDQQMAGPVEPPQHSDPRQGRKIQDSTGR
ncbi:MAG: helix-turn-helix transcriptional regulator [Chloroflexi bacterium]|nr:helix-turn-helix transcriptional regulator [Chloroflexota bacterium]